MMTREDCEPLEISMTIDQLHLFRVESMDNVRGAELLKGALERGIAGTHMEALTF